MANSIQTQVLPVGAGNQISMSGLSVQLAVLLADFSVISIFLIAIDYGYHELILNQSRSYWHFAPVATVIAFLFGTFQCMAGAYQIDVLLDQRRSLRLVLLTWLTVAFIVAWVGFLMKVTEDFSRTVLTLSFVLGLALVLLLRRLAAQVLTRGLERGLLSVRRVYVLCVGDRAYRDKFVAEARRCGVSVVGDSRLDPEMLKDDHYSHACSSMLNDARETFQRRSFDEIYLFFPWGEWARLAELRAAMRQVPLRVFLFADRDVEGILQSPSLAVGRFVGFELQRAPLSEVELLLKRTMDVAIAGSALLLLAPLFALVSAAILYESGAPVIFRQRRKGIGGRPFTILKFRTMRVCEDGDTITQAAADDPRVTPLGVVLRRNSIDELPQLVNVLRGEMSIVGPRPHAVAHDEYYNHLIDSYCLRHKVKPGLTGWAQINGCRGETKQLEKMAERVRLDIWYVNNWSIWVDIKIIARTMVTILLDRNAY